MSEEQKFETDVIETYVIKKYNAEDYDADGDPYEEITITYKNGVLVEHEVSGEEEENGTS